LQLASLAKASAAIWQVGVLTYGQASDSTQ